MPSKPVKSNVVQVPSPSLWFALIIVHLFIPLVLFICAGDFGWWQAWGYSVLFFLAGIVGRILAEKRHPGILVERINAEKSMNAKPWDKVLSPLMAISLSFPLLIVSGLDHRYGWSPEFSTWLNILGLLIVALGYAFSVWAFVENNFFSSTVHIQTQRGHSVCDTGPYKIVRHPGYAGNLFALVGIIIALDSLWTVIPVLIAIIIAIIRTSLEDRTLQEELKGYKEYGQKIHYRLIPGIY